MKRAVFNTLDNSGQTHLSLQLVGKEWRDLSAPLECRDPHVMCHMLDFKLLLEKKIFRKSRSLHGCLNHVPQVIFFTIFLHYTNKIVCLLVTCQFKLFPFITV